MKMMIDDDVRNHDGGYVRDDDEQGGVIFEKKSGHFARCLKLFQDPNSEISL